ncbi:MAG: hypothetical protein HQL66_06010 [Magnetococcales bacterium]|nr:hypothetical protein [Magnetococcales bacterium]
MSVTGLNLGMDLMAKGYARQATQNLAASMSSESRTTNRLAANVADDASGKIALNTRGISTKADTVTFSRGEVARGLFYAPPQAG